VVVFNLWVPDIIHGPMARMAPLVHEVWFSNNAEVRPILQFDDLRGTGPKTLAHLGLVLFAVPALFILVRQDKNHLNWCILAVFLGLSLLLALREARWVGYPQILVLAPCVALLQTLFRRFGGPGLAGVVVRVGSVIVLATGQLIASGMLRQGLPLPKSGKPCDLPQISGFLAENYPDRPQNILNFIYSGPELLYRSHHNVVATPYHRNTASIVDTIRFLRGKSDGPAKALAQKRQIDLVLICPADPEASNYRKEAGLLVRLEAGQPPSWLGEVLLPADLGQNFKLYQVIPSAF